MGEFAADLRAPLSSSPIREWDARGHRLRSTVTRCERGRCLGLFSTGASRTLIDQKAMGEMLLIRYDNGVRGYGAQSEHVEKLHGTIL